MGAIMRKIVFGVTLAFVSAICVAAMARGSMEPEPSIPKATTSEESPLDVPKSLSPLAKWSIPQTPIRVAGPVCGNDGATCPDGYVCCSNNIFQYWCVAAGSSC